jgi:hypothetical protein
MIEYKKLGTNNQYVKDGYSHILREASEFFAGQRIHMIGNGFDEILSEQSLFDAYVEKLCKGLTADEADQMSQLMENSRLQIMQEASVAGIQPIASLSMPTVRKMWVKVALKNAIPTEAVKAPKFVISYMEPYLLNNDGSKVSLPQALRVQGNTQANRPRITGTVTSTNLALGTYSVFSLVSGASATPSVALGDAVDPLFTITHVDLKVGGTDADPTLEKVAVNITRDIRGNLVGDVKSANGAVTDTLFATIDLRTGVITGRSLKDLVKVVYVKGTITQENNRNTQSVSFDIKTKDVTIGTGTHLNAPLPIEWLQDTMAMYQIDGALEVVDLMSNVHAQKLDLQILDFLDESFEKAAQPYKGAFDVRPSSTFAGTPKDWREELKTVIDYFAIKMKNDSAFSNGKFVVIGNPLDLNLITNVDWVFNSVTDERGGVEVDFNIGAYSGTQRYEMVSSANVPAGKLRMIFIPSSPKLMTYKYYPYTFNVETKGYIDPNRPNVPSIMMTKRHTIEELTPLACEIEIINNTGSFLNELPR